MSASRCSSSGEALAPQNVDVTSASTLTGSPEQVNCTVPKIDLFQRAIGSVGHPHHSFCLRCGDGGLALGASMAVHTTMATNTATIKQTNSTFQILTRASGREAISIPSDTCPCRSFASRPVQLRARSPQSEGDSPHANFRPSNKCLSRRRRTAHRLSEVLPMTATLSDLSRAANEPNAALKLVASRGSAGRPQDTSRTIPLALGKRRHPRKSCADRELKGAAPPAVGVVFLPASPPTGRRAAPWCRPSNKPTRLAERIIVTAPQSANSPRAHGRRGRRSSDPDRQRQTRQLLKVSGGCGRCWSAKDFS